jgi:hypothetical protein
MVKEEPLPAPKEDDSSKEEKAKAGVPPKSAALIQL